MSHLLHPEQDPHAQTDVAQQSRKDLYRGFFTLQSVEFTIRRFDGTISAPMQREIIDRGDSVAVLPYDPVTDKVCLIRQFLPGAHFANLPNRPLQVIAGKVDFDESFHQVALRESVEEAGIELDLDHLEWVQTFQPSPGGMTERVACFIARADLSNAGGLHGLAEEGEDIAVEIHAAEDAIAMLDAGHIEAGPAVVTLLSFARHHARLRADWL